MRHTPSPQSHRQNCNYVRVIVGVATVLSRGGASAAGLGGKNDQVKNSRQIHVATPIIAVEPKSPATARPRLGAATSGVGVGLSVGSGVAVGSSLRRGVAEAVAVAVGPGVSVGTDVGTGVGVAVGTGVGVLQKGGMQGPGVGVGVGVGLVVGGGVN